MKKDERKFGWALTLGARRADRQDDNAPDMTVFTFTYRADADAFLAHNSGHRLKGPFASYEMRVPEHGSEGVIYEIHTRAGGGCGTLPAGADEWPHVSTE